MTNSIQNRLFQWAVVFIFLYSVILTLSPAVRERSWAVDYRWTHWLGFVIWLVIFFMADREIAHKLPERDPYLLPCASILIGWGLLTIWRLDFTFGLRQSIWLALTGGLFIFALRYHKHLILLRHYKYLLLSGGLILTSLTLIFGTNPGGIGPRLWLGCCGIYFQPSEPLKLLFVLYLAAYLADYLPIRLKTIPLLLPTLFVMGLSLVLLLVQRDLGTASIFILLYTVVLYLATQRRRVMVSAAIGLSLALLIGYLLFDIVRIRVNAWLNPWADPSGNSYQIVQSLLAIANGGTIGRGPGLGNPGLVPVAISDFIFAAIAEEMGLAGVIGLTSLLLLIIARGLIAALRAPDGFRRLTAAGITAYIGIQSLLIIGGNLRFLPLTGVTLPFVSYGGSSLLTSLTALLLLLIIGAKDDIESAALPRLLPYSILGGLIGTGLLFAVMITGWWSLVRGPDLLTRTDNPRRAIADRYVPRGSLMDRNNGLINITTGQRGSYRRIYLYPNLSPITGYTHPTYGQAGLEASLDDFLRGVKGYPASQIWSEYLLYGTPPAGLPVRLSIDLTLQSKADQLLGSHTGAIILMQANSGEILAMASHPSYNANLLDDEGKDLSRDPSSPLINRATQGKYSPGTALIPFAQAGYGESEPTDAQLHDLYESLGFFDSPVLETPIVEASADIAGQDLRISPLQLAMASATLSNHGIMPAPRIALALGTIQQGWVVLPAQSQPVQVFDMQAANKAALDFSVNQVSYWQHLGQASQDGSFVTWLLTGTLPDWQGTPLIAVLALEENNTFLAESIARELIAAALIP